jgi:hypothetical protein
VQPEHLDDEVAERVPGGRPAARLIGVFDSMLSFCDNDSILS